MARRVFELPGIQDLSKEQERVRALPKKGQHLIIGGPGTGKSILALLRARRHATSGEPHFFLVYNRLLHEASCHLGGQNVNCHQWMRWFSAIFKQITGNGLPRLPVAPGSTFREIDWQGVDQVVSQNCPAASSSELKAYLIIDEGQDMPPEFYRTLVRLGFENFFVAADQNQQIVTGKNSSRRDIEIELGIGSDKVIELTRNYRNTRPIARFARTFHTGDRASPELQLPDIAGKKGIIPIIFTYHPGQFDEIIHRILKMAGREPDKLIGVIAPNNRIRKEYFQALIHREGTMEGDHADIHIRTYCATNQGAMHFNEGGIMVINGQACKGLEFDHVFIVSIDDYFCQAGMDDAVKRFFYVMVARARYKVILLRQKGSYCAVNRLLPDDPTILEEHPR